MDFAAVTVRQANDSVIDVLRKNGTSGTARTDVVHQLRKIMNYYQVVSTLERLHGEGFIKMYKVGRKKFYCLPGV